MTATRRPEDPIDALGLEISRLQEAVRDLQRPQPFRIPVLLADPPTTDPTNLWLFPDGRLRGRHLNTAGTAFTTREWVPSAPGSATSGSAPAAPADAPITRTGSWAATWSHSYRETGQQRTDGGATHLYYGSSGDPFNGRNRSLVGFDYTTIAAALAGSTVTAVWLRLVNIHSWWNSGSDIHFGIHNYTAKPTTWTGGGIPRSMITKHHFGKPQDRTVVMPIEFATMIRDGTGKGIALESPSDSLTFYGYAAGFGSGNVLPTLIVRYAK